MKSSRLLLMLFAVISLVFGLLTGLLRIGWNIEVSTIGGHHGVMMLGGFLGTLICLERAVALKRQWGFLVPALSGFSIVFFLTGLPRLGYLSLVLASVGLIGIYIAIARLKKGSYVEPLLIGAICWLAGNILLYQTQFYPVVFPWWMAFIMFTIVGERLELTRFLPVSGIQKRLLGGLLLLMLIGFMLPYHGVGRHIAGIGFVTISIWLFRFDLASVLLKKRGHYAFTGFALCLGYGWLAISGVLMIMLSDASFGFDAFIHAFFIGFTFSMIFAHGPIVFPGIFGKTRKPFHRILWFWLGLLQLSVAARVLADFMESETIRKWSGMANGFSILFFLITMIILLKKGEKLTSNI